MRRRCAALKDDSGAAALVVAIVTAFALMAMAAVVIDAGMLYSERRSVQTAADSAALAGVQELPTSPSNARTVADQYVGMNPGGSTATVREYDVLSTYMANDTLKVHITAPSFNLLLTKFIGVSTARVGASATAVLSSPSAYSKGVMPFGIMSRDTSGTSPFGYTFNEMVTLKQAAGTTTGTAGNFQLVDLDGTNSLKKVVEAGGASAYIGQQIQSHPGNVASLLKTLDKIVSVDSRSFSDVVQVQPDGTVKILDYSSPHLIVCPIVYAPPNSYSWADLNGKSDLTILGLAWFWVQSAKDGTGPNGQATITGSFIRPLSPEEVADWGAPDPYGAIAFRLID